MRFRDLYFLFIAVSLVCDIICRPCDLYVAPSLLSNAGYGVFTGRDIRFNSIVESCTSVLFGEDLFLDTQLENYLYSAHDPRFAAAVLGAGRTNLLYNIHC